MIAQAFRERGRQPRLGSQRRAGEPLAAERILPVGPARHGCQPCSQGKSHHDKQGAHEPEEPAEGGEAASLFDRKTKNFPSRDQRGDVSFLSLVNVICLVDASPSLIETRKMSVWRLAWLQSGVESVYNSHLPSGLGVGEPISRCSCRSRKVIGRNAADGCCCAARANGISATEKARRLCMGRNRPGLWWRDLTLRHGLRSDQIRPGRHAENAVSDSEKRLPTPSPATAVAPGEAART